MTYYGLLVRDAWRILDNRLLDICLIKSGSGPAVVAKQALKHVHSVSAPPPRVDQRGCRARQKCQSDSPYVPIHSYLSFLLPLYSTTISGKVYRNSHM